MSNLTLSSQMNTKYYPIKPTIDKDIRSKSCDKSINIDTISINGDKEDEKISKQLPYRKSMIHRKSSPQIKTKYTLNEQITNNNKEYKNQDKISAQMLRRKSVDSCTTSQEGENFIKEIKLMKDTSEIKSYSNKKLKMFNYFKNF